MSESNTTATTHSIPTINPLFRLQYEQAQESWVLLYPEGMVKLNPSAAEIMQRCDGKRTLSDIVQSLEEAFETTGLEKDVLGFADVALEQRWIQLL
ncbi:MAG: pyrroloquinoline quinone biosynthesis peptide chaperone PqqD [Granulosicoccus sp.]|nr:pyrroloquinoline quinone biosynthesis peptide chaperone PqqD [Granulosicoccus sp.]